MAESPTAPNSFFAPSERLDPAAVQAQAALFGGTPLADMLLNAGLNCLLVLNRQRQIVAASRNVCDLVPGATLEELLGKRPGEALGCIHATACPGGCGTSEFCRECGAVQTILQGLDGKRCQQECRMTRRIDGVEQSLDLLILTTPLVVNDERFTLLAVTDISHEKRRSALERIFFHDTLNLASGAEDLLASIKALAPEELREDLELSQVNMRELIETIQAQRDLAAAERDELIPRPSLANTCDLLHQVALVYQCHPVAEHRSIFVDSAVDSVDFQTDQNLLRRVLGNLAKNAAEASAPGETITLDCREIGQELVFTVRNPQVMPRAVQLQIFQRSFSTKGPGRGLGTYSVKLLTERCLKGSVGFSSRDGEGTVFRVTLPLRLA
ncbi:MAG: sensor histidine kinase [Opitutae bacterium]|nr:sensor histidine kinase [Opitutae bacterium]